MAAVASSAILPSVERSALFTFVGRGFLSTDPAELLECWRQLDPSGEYPTISRALAGLRPEDLEREHVRLFLAPEGAPCPPWQSVHGDEAQLMGASHHSAIEWFRSYGVEPARETEPADHAGLLLSFFGHLLAEEAENALEFLASHLTWIRGFCDQVERHTSLDFYRLLAAQTGALLDSAE
ncbi:MAG: molecular chaperone TorD family protein [Bryobacterales bacterium]|nr:molecular chaperone TorD family protein [Bryobacterales bacterium]